MVKIDFTPIVGMTVDNARKYLEENRHTLRVAHEDGEPLILTMDLRMNRVNVAVVEGVVVRVMDIG